jgi:hypothetical protein
MPAFSKYAYSKSEVTIPTPRCPLCDAKLESMQLQYFEAPNSPGNYCWHEVWNCDKCNTNHSFPARLAFLEQCNSSILQSKTFERAGRILHLPRNIRKPGER